MEFEESLGWIRSSPVDDFHSLTSTTQPPWKTKRRVSPGGELVAFGSAGSGRCLGYVVATCVAPTGKQEDASTSRKAGKLQNESQVIETHTHAYSHMHVCPHTQTDTHKYVHTEHTRANTYMHKHTATHSNTHTHTHTHKQTHNEYPSLPFNIKE